MYHPTRPPPPHDRHRQHAVIINAHCHAARAAQPPTPTTSSHDYDATPPAPLAHPPTTRPPGHPPAPTASTANPSHPDQHRAWGCVWVGGWMGVWWWVGIRCAHRCIDPHKCTSALRAFPLGFLHTYTRARKHARARSRPSVYSHVRVPRCAFVRVYLFSVRTSNFHDGQHRRSRCARCHRRDRGGRDPSRRCMRFGECCCSQQGHRARNRR